MTNQEILEKAIQKAKNAGWSAEADGYTPDGLAALLLAEPLMRAGWSLEEIIFSHDFAKALWGERWLKSTGPGIGEYEKNDGWQYHLRNMVIAPDPIKYLGENI